jgi:phenylacetate-CoA ligase
MTEVGPVTYSDIDDPNLLRIVHDTYLAEVVDQETGDPVAYGEVGELILTTLGRGGCPLLRYRTGDLVRPVAVGDEDPSAFALQGGILGRADDMVVVRGVNLYPSAIDTVARSLDGIGEYQVTIDRTQPMVQVSIVVENESGESDEALIEEFEKRLRDAFALRIPVTVSEAGSLPRFEMKARRWNVIG